MPPATGFVQKCQGICSIYTLKVEPGRRAFRYDVDISRLPMPKRNGTMDDGKSLVRGADELVWFLMNLKECSFVVDSVH